jgi:hypothetical protein
VAGSCAGTGDALEVVCGVLREIGSNSGLQFLSRYQTDLSQYQPQTDPTTTAQPAPAPDAVSLLELGDSIVGALEDQLVEPLAGSAPPVQHAPERRAPGPAARTVEPLHGLGPGPPATPQRVRGPEAGERTGPASPVPAAARPASRGDARARAPAAEPVPAHRPALERPPPPEPLTTPSSSGAPAGGASAGSFGSGSGGAGAVASLTALFLLALLDQLRRLRLESSQPRSVHVASFPERPG